MYVYSTGAIQDERWKIERGVRKRRREMYALVLLTTTADTLHLFFLATYVHT